MEKQLVDLINKTSFSKLFNLKKYSYNTEGDYNLNIIGVRNLLNSVPSKINPHVLHMVQRDEFNDALIITFKENGIWKRYVWEATTDPGLKILKAPSTSKGTAILVPGQYKDTYKKDFHRGAKTHYEAVCQRLNKVSIYRDSNKDNTLDMDPTKIETGFFGINIHRASAYNINNTIGANSAGCQVFKSYKDFDTFMFYIDKAIKLHGNKFTYTLLTTNDLTEFIKNQTT